MDGATAGNVSAGNLFSPTYAIATDINGTKKVTKISSTADAFAAVRDDGSVVTWGNSSNGGDSRSVSSSLDGSVNVRDIYSNMSAFAALREDGSVITWGYDSFGGNSSSVANKITNKSHSDFSAVTDHKVGQNRRHVVVISLSGLGNSNPSNLPYETRWMMEDDLPG